ncbi:MAG: hypothetical protein ACI4M9_07630 [Succinivibrio sp.]
MLVFVISFAVFLLFVLALSLSLIIKKRPMVSEDDARAGLLDDGACATCGKLCALAGQKNVTPTKKCKIENTKIPHKNI